MGASTTATTVTTEPPYDFHHFDPVVSPGKKDQGKQAKAKWTGRYTNKTHQEFYIKRSALYIADDEAEVVGSSLLTALIGEELAIPYQFVIGKEDGVYVASEVRSHFETLKQRVGTLPEAHSEPLTKTNKENIQNALIGYWAEMGKILAACLLLRDYDCQTGNMAFYKTALNGEKIAKYDNGWSLSGICKQKSSRVDLFGKRAFFGKAATHKRGGIPTNHFRDYLLIKEQAFIDGLEHVIHAPVDFNAVVNAALDKLEIAYQSNAKDGQKSIKEALMKFAEHIGLKENITQYELLKEMEIPSIRKHISEELVNTLSKRKDSMKLLSILLKIRLELRKDRIDQNKIHHFLKEVETVLKSDFSLQKGYDPSQLISEILPVFGRRLNEWLRIARDKQMDLSNIWFFQPSAKLQDVQKYALEPLHEHALPQFRSGKSEFRITSDQYEPMLIEKMNEAVHIIRQKTGYTHRIEIDKLKKNFSIVGIDPLSVIREAQKRGAMPVSYRLNLKANAETALYESLKLNAAKKSADEVDYVYISQIQVDGKVYLSEEAFMLEYENKHKLHPLPGHTV